MGNMMHQNVNYNTNNSMQGNMNYINTYNQFNMINNNNPPGFNGNQMHNQMGMQMQMGMMDMNNNYN